MNVPFQRRVALEGANWAVSDGLDDHISQIPCSIPSSLSMGGCEGNRYNRYFHCSSSCGGAVRLQLGLDGSDEQTSPPGLAILNDARGLFLFAW